MKTAKAIQDRPLANCYYPANVATSTTDLDINDFLVHDKKGFSAKLPILWVLTSLIYGNKSEKAG